MNRPGRRWLGRVAVVVAAGVLGWFAWREARSAWYLRQAEAAYDRHDWPGALRAAQRQLAFRPHDPRGASLAARSLTRLDRPVEAEAYYRDTGPLGRDDLHFRALALYKGQRHDDAARVYEEILQRWPDDPLALRRLGAVRIALNQWLEALKLAERLIAQPAQEVAGQSLAGAIYHNLGNYRQAIAANRRVLALDPELRQMPMPETLFWSQFARDLMYEGQTAGARELLNRALARRDDALLLDLLGQTYMKEGDPDEAERIWLRAVEVDSTQGDPWLDLGRLALRRQRLDDAVRFLTRAAALSPEAIDPLYNLSQARRLLGQTEEANRLQRKIDQMRANR